MNIQKFSIFHDANEAALKEWHAPYADLFAGFSPVLDVGCGPGYFQELLKERAIDALGVDIDPEMVELAESRGNNVILGTQETISGFRNQFSGVHISHVVEHLWGDELLRLLENSAAALKPGGIIVIRTPNWGNQKVREFLFWMDHTHKRPYPWQLLARITADLGFVTLDYGQEPFGMEDTYFVAQKRTSSGVSAEAGPKKLCWERIARAHSIRDRLRRRIKRWLDEPSTW